MRRRLILLTHMLMGVLLVGLIACDGDQSDSVTSTPPLTPTATPTRSSTTTPDGGGEVAGDDFALADPGLDAIYQAVLRGDLGTLSGLVEYQVVGCTYEQGAGGPPKCEEPQEEGDEVRVFPVVSCEGGWTDTPVVTLGNLVMHQRGLYAAVDAPSQMAEIDWPPQSAYLIFHTSYNGNAMATRLHITEAGRIIALWSACGVGDAEYVAGRLATYQDEPLEVIAGTFAPRESAPDFEQASTGIPEIDEVLAAVAAYDLAALYEGAVRAMQETPTVACEADQIMEGPAIACDPKNGEVDGTLVHVFPSAYCHGAYDRSPQRPLLAFLNQAPVLHSVFEAPSEPSPSANFPHGAYWAIYELTAKDAFPDAVRLHISDAGQVLMVWYGCDGTVERLMDGAGTEITISPAE